MGRCSAAPVPSTSDARSPAPITTGVPGASPSSSATGPATPPVTWSGANTGASLADARPARPPSTCPVLVVQPGPRRHGDIRGHRTGQPPDHQVPWCQHPGTGFDVAHGRGWSARRSWPPSSRHRSRPRIPDRSRRRRGPGRAPRPRRPPADPTTPGPARAVAPRRRPGRRTGGRRCSPPRPPSRNPRGRGPGARRTHRSGRSTTRWAAAPPTRAPDAVVATGAAARATSPLWSQSPTLVRVVPRSMVRITIRGRPGPVVPPWRPGDGSCRMARPMARPAPPPAMTSRASSTTRSASPRCGPPRKSTGTPTLPTTRLDGPDPVRSGPDVGDRHLEQGRTEVVGDDRGQHDVVDRPGHAPVAPHHRLDQGLEPVHPGLLQHPAQELEGRRSGRVGRIDAGHQLDPRPAVRRRPGHRGHQTVVELERRARQPGPVEREVGPLPVREVTGAGQVTQGLRRGQDPVAVGQGGTECGEVVGVPLDGGHPTGAVVGRQHQGRGVERPVGRRHRSAHRPDSPRTTLATDEKSSRP